MACPKQIGLTSEWSQYILKKLAHYKWKPLPDLSAAGLDMELKMKENIINNHQLQSESMESALLIVCKWEDLKIRTLG